MEFLTFSGLTFVPCCNKVISSHVHSANHRDIESPTIWGLYRIYSSKVVVQFWEKTEHRRDNGIGENLWPEGDLRVQAWPQLLFNLAKLCKEKQNIAMRWISNLKLCELLSVALIRFYWHSCGILKVAPAGPILYYNIILQYNQMERNIMQHNMSNLWASEKHDH